MPDYSMCQTETNCPNKKTCKRHADSGVVPDVYQSYVEWKWTAFNGCSGYWPKYKMSEY